MTEGPTQQPEAVAAISSVRVVQDTPVVFADGVTSQSSGVGFSKFFFHRWDPDPEAKGPGKATQVLQMVMPTDGFLSMVMFFEHRIKIMVKEGSISQADVDKKRAFYDNT